MRVHHQAMLTRARVRPRGRIRSPLRHRRDYDWAVRVFLNGSVSKRFVPV